MSSTLVTFSKLSKGNLASPVEFAEIGYSLPFPRGVEISTEYNWEPEALGIIGSAIFRGNNDFGAMKSGLDSLKGIGEKIYSQASGIAAGLVGAGDSGSAASAVLGNQKMASNPKEEVLFKGVKHRRFELTFDLAPLTAKDSLAVMSFLSKLHEFAAPELTGGGAFFKYPGTVNIVIRGDGSGGGGVTINRGNCAIISINCNLSPESIWASFRNGKPVHVVVTIGFCELNLPTKDTDKNLFT
jgi:hypothetical protein